MLLSDTLPQIELVFAAYDTKSINSAGQSLVLSTGRDAVAAINSETKQVAVFPRGETKEGFEPYFVFSSCGLSASKRTNQKDSTQDSLAFSRGRTRADGGHLDHFHKPHSNKSLEPETDGTDTVSLHYKNGKWSKERSELHDKIVEKYVGGKSPVNSPTAYFMGGGTASGKSSVIRSGMVTIPENRIEIDPDALKAELPEYQNMIEAGDDSAAAFVHEESSYLSKRIAAVSFAGQKVVATYVTIPTEVAVERAKKRAERSGRAVPDSVIRSIHSAVSDVVPKAVKAGLFDELEVYDNNVKQGENPRLIARAKGKKLDIVDEQLWDEFVGKANADN